MISRAEAFATRSCAAGCNCNCACAHALVATSGLATQKWKSYLPLSCFLYVKNSATRAWLNRPRPTSVWSSSWKSTAEGKQRKANVTEAHQWHLRSPDLWPKVFLWNLSHA